MSSTASTKKPSTNTDCATRSTPKKRKQLATLCVVKSDLHKNTGVRKNTGTSNDVLGLKSPPEETVIPSGDPGVSDTVDEEVTESKSPPNTVIIHHLQLNHEGKGILPMYFPVLNNGLFVKKGLDFFCANMH